MKVLAPSVRTWRALTVLLLVTGSTSLIGSWAIVSLAINLTIARATIALTRIYRLEQRSPRMTAVRLEN